MKNKQYQPPLTVDEQVENLKSIGLAVANISYVRNICAHYGRLYNVNLAKTPSLYKQYSKMGISNVRVFATLLCLKKLLLNDRHWHEFVDTIESLFEKYPHVKIELMGFPIGWEEILRN